MEEEIEYVELDEDDVVEEVEIHVHVNCPVCGKVYSEYNIDFEKDYICECETCGHKFKFNYCPY